MREQVQEWLDFYVELLHLQGWHLTFEIMRYYEIEHEVLGETHIHESLRQARIHLMHPDDYAPRYETNGADLELVLVHELIHIVLHDLFVYADQANVPNFVIERAVEDVAMALVDLRRHAHEQ